MEINLPQDEFNNLKNPIFQLASESISLSSSKGSISTPDPEKPLIAGILLFLLLHYLQIFDYYNIY